ncbi:zinc-dependent alcohol dehydrogenase [Sphingopyxis sp. 22461]|uniref:zinc-dependent alcohol dehydrogenase n=1 Tax=Sphingopyxis sp. 22461 TaxID=3453923 RepID=UPI003F85D193
MAITTHSDRTAPARAVVFEDVETFVVRPIALPPIGPDDMLVEVLLCGVDGSELHMYRGELPWFNARVPIIFGDEIIGRVAQIGAAAAQQRGMKVGDRITIEARWPCDRCRCCAEGQYYLCENNPDGRGYGTISMGEAPGLWGGYATHVFVPQPALAYPVPEELTLEAALVSCSLLANSLAWVKQAELKRGGTLVVIGPGPQGIGCALVAAHRGAKVVVLGLERDAERLAFAESLSPSISAVVSGPEDDIAGTIEKVSGILGEVDAVIEAAGVPSAKEFAFALVRRTGRVLQVSIPFPHVQPVDWQNALMKELTILNPVSHPHAVKPALALGVELARDGIDVGRFVSHRFGLDDAAEAIEVASYRRSDSPIKVVLNPAM